MNHPGGPPPSLGSAAAWMARIASDRVRLLSLFEQGLISATNFLALLILARNFSPELFGTFSFAWLTLFFVINLHRSAVVVPFVIHTAEPGVLAAQSSVWRRLNHWTTGLSALGLALTAAALPLFDAPDWMGTAFLIAAALVIPAFTYEFRRRWLIQQDRYGATVAAAILYAAISLGGVWLAATAHSLKVAAVAFALSHAGAALICLVLSPTLPKPAKQPAFIPFLKRLGHFIGWSVASNLAYNGYGHLPPLILGALAGPQPVALFQAMRNFTQPLSTAATAVDNFDKPRAARALSTDGITGLRRALLHTTIFMAAMTAPYLLLLLLAGDTLVDMVYGLHYGDPTHTLAWFAAVHVAVVFVYPVETSLFLLRRPDLLFRSRIVSAAIGIGLCFALVPHWGLAGAMAGITAGIVVSGLAGAFLIAREKLWTRT